MHSLTTSVPLQHKSFGLMLALACALALPAVTRAADQDADPDAQRAQAVSQYVTGAKQQLDAYRQIISADTNSDDRKAVTAAKAKLSNCDQLLDQLKAADASQFDIVKANYEHAVGDLQHTLPNKS